MSGDSRRRIGVLLIVVVIGIALAGVLYHCGGNCDRGGGGDPLDYSLDDLGLNSAQREKIGALVETHQQGLAAAREKIAVERIALSRMLAGSDWNRAALKEQCEKISDLQCRQQMALIDHLGEVSKVLDDAQREKLFAVIECELCRTCRGECGGECLCGKCGED